jgi:hypothetical protein
MARTPGTAVVVALIVGVGLAALGPVETAASAPTPRCADQRGTTLLASERIRVLARRGTAYACYRGSRRLFVLGDHGRQCSTSSGCVEIGGFRIAGRYLGYVETFSGRDAGSTTIYLVDMKRYRDRNVWGESPSGTSTQIGDLEVTERGSVAFIAMRGHPQSGLPDRSVHRIQGPPAGDEAELLDSGPEIDGDSLARSATHLYWTHGAGVRSASIE